MRIGVVGELYNNKLSHKTYDSIVKVNNLSLDHNQVEIDLLLLDAKNQSLKSLPCDRVFIYNQLTGENVIDKTAKAIEYYFGHHKPSLIIVALSEHVDNIIPKSVSNINTVSNDHQLTSGFLSCDHIRFDETIKKIVVCKPVYGGNVLAHYSIATAAIISFKSPVKSKEVLTLKEPEVDYVDCRHHFDNHHINRREMELIEIEGFKDADFVVVCGKGLGSKQAVESITAWASKVGAVVGGTKKVIDHGWLPIHQLIGQTGHTIAPKICLVIGASGARPFINGIISSEKIIAINNDKNARIFDYADIGIVEDYKLIANVLQSEFNEVGD